MRYFFILLLPFLGCNAQSITTESGLVSAINAAKQNGGVVNVSGEILITQKIEIDFDCVINGGVLKTKDSTTVAFNLFEVKKGGKLTCNDLTVYGPKYAGGTTENVPFTTAFFMESGAQLYLNDCNIYGQFNNAISKTSAADSVHLKSVLSINGGEIEAFAQCVSFFTVNNNKECFLRCEGVKFLRSGVPAAQNNGGAYGHTLYIHPNVHTEIVGCDFLASERNCISYFSGGAITSPGSLMVSNCRFLEGCKGAVYAETYGTANVENCTFLGLEGVRVGRGDFVVKNNYFLGNASASLINTIGAFSSLSVQENVFKPSFIPNYAGYAMIGGVHAGKYNYSGNTFFGTFYNGSIALNLSNVDAVFMVTENSFFCNPTYAVRADRGLFLVTDNLYIGPTVKVQYNSTATKYVKDGN